jgi:SAM-dependent methyltransferase
MAGPDITGPDWADPGIAGPAAQPVDASAPATATHAAATPEPATPEPATHEATTPEAEGPALAGQLTALGDESAVDMPALAIPAEQEPAAGDLDPVSLISLTDQTEGEPASPSGDDLAAVEDLQADNGLLDDSGPPISEIAGEPPAPLPGPREAPPAALMALPGEDLAAEPTRVPYEACPLCSAEGYEPLRQAETELLLQGRLLRVPVPWVRCSRCSHVFTNGYFAGEAWARILKQTLRWRRTLRRAIAARPEASRIVAAITILRESAQGRWLDVGCSESGLVAVAAEFGYDAAGVDCCSEAAERLASLGYSVTAGSLFDCKGEPFDVVSLSNVVDRMPFPAQALSHLHKLLAPRGLLYVSARTSDSLRWRKLDAENANPNWGRLDLYHVFQRKSLFRLLQTSGFEPCSYGASGSDGLGMEVVACRR